MRFTVACSSAAVAASGAPIQKTNSNRLRKLRNPRQCPRRYFVTSVPIDAVGDQPLVRVQRLVPGDLLAGVGGHAAHHREKRACGHALAVVDGIVAANGGKQDVVFALVHVVFLAVPRPVVLALNARNGSASDGAGAVYA